jgi:hypothetical protein
VILKEHSKLKEILDKLIDSLSNGNVLLAMVIVAVALVFNYKKIVEFFEEREKARIVKLSEALQCEHISGLTKSHLEDELATELFKITTGIRLEKEFREAVIQAHKNTQGELNFIHFKRALPYIFYKDLKLEIKISTFDQASYWFNLFFGFILAFSGLLLIALPSQIKGINIVQALSVLGTGAFLMAIALFMLSQTFPIVSAHKISNELKKIHNNLIPPSAKSSTD